MARKKRYQWNEGSSVDAAEAPSRSQKKRDSTALQKLGEELAHLPLTSLTHLPLSPDLDEALRLLARITDHEGRRRQKQYIGRLMREVDPLAMREALDAIMLGHSQNNAAFHRAERLRTSLLDAKKDSVEEATLLAPLLALPTMSPAQAATLITLVHEAREEVHQLGTSKARPPHAQRALFRRLRELL